ncbi:MAG: CoA-transferase [Syntrophaceae bacterium]|nr:CoA-transferase [Syntrophaceae bacterium]
MIECDRSGEPNLRAADYTMQELMVVAGAREIRDDDVVFVGMRLPLLAFQLAKATHAPHAIGIFENGILRDKPAGDALYTMGDTPNIEGAIWTTSMMDIMSLLQSGKVSLGFIGGAEVDRFGNLNTTYIGGKERVRIRLPGSGGGSDIASLAGRVIIMMSHERRRFVERVSYITSPGFGDGENWRERNGLKGGGPCAVITTKGILRFDSKTKEMVLDSVHPGVIVEEVLENTGWNLNYKSRIKETDPPTRLELRTIRRFDPTGFWTRNGMK